MCCSRHVEQLVDGGWQIVDTGDQQRRSRLGRNSRWLYVRAWFLRHRWTVTASFTSLAEDVEPVQFVVKQRWQTTVVLAGAGDQTCCGIQYSPRSMTRWPGDPTGLIGVVSVPRVSNDLIYSSTGDRRQNWHTDPIRPDPTRQKLLIIAHTRHPFYFFITWSKCIRFRWFLVHSILKKLDTKRLLCFPPHLYNVSALYNTIYFEYL